VSGSAPEESFWGDERSAVDGVLRWVADRVTRHSDPKSTARPAAELTAQAGAAITPAGIGWQAALDVFDRVLIPATRAQDDPLNLAYVPAAPTRSAIAFDLATSAANIFAGMWEAGAGAIHAENEALAWLVELLGWPSSAGGTFVSGGTMGNLAALMTAREAMAARRLRPEGGWALACSEGAHSSIRSAARILDVGVVTVPTDAQGRLSGAELREVLAVNPHVFAVVASAGTTNAGIVDDLAGAADACAESRVWLHVDGAYGGAALAAPSVRHLFDGIERADSFIVDPHKWLFAPYDCCALLYREPDVARSAHSQHAIYLDQIDRGVWNPADLAPHLTRRARGLPFWFSLAVHGTDEYRAAVETTIATARAVAAGIEASAHLRLVREPELSVVLFDRPGWAPEHYRAWSQRAAVEGAILCVPTLAFVNPDTDPDRVLEALATLR
jgi:glutamate/tyrosine decarboxylase-like PLP-dependent enzyme